MQKESLISNVNKNRQSEADFSACNKRPDFFKPVIQPKLSINQPNDTHEQEADAIADKVMRMIDQGDAKNAFFKPANSHTLDTVSRKENTANEVQGGSQLDNYVSSLGSSGQPLPYTAQNFFEPRFGQDFSNVRIHTDPVAAKSAQSINALAYTSGNNIVFNSGQFAPESDEGKKLMAHELTHVVQQKGPGNIQKQPAPKLPEFTVGHFVNGDFKNFGAQYDVTGPMPAMGTLFITHGVHMNYPATVTKAEQTVFENDFVKGIHDTWSNKHLLNLAEPGFAPYMCKVDVAAQVKADPKEAQTVIDVVKPSDQKKRFRARVSEVDKKDDSATVHKATLDLRDPTVLKNNKTDKADFIRQVGDFEFDSDVINADCKTDIEKIKDFIKTIPKPKDPDECGFSLRYVGRASSEGSATHNKELSGKRIQAVKKELDAVAGTCMSIEEYAGAEGATLDTKFRRVNVGVFISDTNKPTTTDQNVAAHEFGHMIGLGDEYTDTKPEVPGSKIKFFGDDPTHFDAVNTVVDETAANEVLIQSSANIMSLGNEVQRGHYVMFAAAMDFMTRPEIESATGKKDAKWNVL